MRPEERSFTAPDFLGLDFWLDGAGLAAVDFFDGDLATGMVKKCCTGKRGRDALSGIIGLSAGIQGQFRLLLDVRIYKRYT